MYVLPSNVKIEPYVKVFGGKVKISYIDFVWENSKECGDFFALWCIPYTACLMGTFDGDLKKLDL